MSKDTSDQAWDQSLTLQHLCVYIHMHTNTHKWM